MKKDGMYVGKTVVANVTLLAKCYELRINVNKLLEDAMKAKIKEMDGS